MAKVVKHSMVIFQDNLNTEQHDKTTLTHRRSNGFANFVNQYKDVEDFKIISHSSVLSDTSGYLLTTVIYSLKENEII